MKRIISLALCLLLVLAAVPLCAGATEVIVPTPQKMLVNGTETAFEAYNIDGSNYFKLRDVAYVLRGTLASFSLAYDEQARTIAATPGEEYEPIGGELATGEDKSATARLSNQPLLINGTKVELAAYNIGGNNFFKLRELGERLGFTVEYDAVANAGIITSPTEAEPVEDLTLDVKLAGGFAVTPIGTIPAFTIKQLVTAEATGGTGDYQYLFVVRAGGAVRTTQPYSESNTMQITLAGAVGVCTVTVTVKDFAGTTVDVTKSLIVNS